VAGRTERKIAALSPANIDDLPPRCRSCSYWLTSEKLPARCGVAQDAETKREWVEGTSETWGECGTLLYIDSEVVGHGLYGPATAFPQAVHFGCGPISADAVFLSCLLVREDARHHGVAKTVLQAIEKSLYTRRAKAIEAIARASDLEELTALGPVDFYLKNGFYIKSDHPRYPLVRLDLKTALPWQFDLEAMLQSLSVQLRPMRAPAPSS